MTNFLKTSIKGVGSYEVESFMSFFCRWAWLHYLTPSAFALEVAKKWENVSGEKFPVNAKGFHSAKQLLIPAGFSSAFLHASAFILDDPFLERGTFFPLMDCMSIGNSVCRQRVRWCEECFSDHLDSGTTPYIRLYWTLHDADRCFRHGKYLVSSCPHCYAPQDRIMVQDSFAHCQSCKRHMTTGEDRGKVTAKSHIDEHSIAMMHLCDLLSNGWRAERGVIRSNLLTIFRSRAFEYGPPHPYKGCAVTRNTYYNLVSECRKFIKYQDYRMSIFILFYIAEAVANISFLEVLTSDRPVWQTALKLGDPPNLPPFHIPIRPVKDRHRDHFGVLHRFKQISSEEGQLESLKAVAAKLGVSVGYLQYRFPSEVSEYRQKYKTYKAQDRRLRRAKAITVVRAYLADAGWPEVRVSRPKLVKDLRSRTGLGRNDLETAAIMVMGVGKATVTYRAKPRSKFASNALEEAG